MRHAEGVLRAHPNPIPQLDLVQRAAMQAMDCAAACTSCADACLSEPDPAALRGCIRLNLDCADVCAATAATVLRLTRPHRAPMTALLLACAETCGACAAECGGHAAMHAHCAACQRACQACEAACRALLAAMDATDGATGLYPGAGL